MSTLIKFDLKELKQLANDKQTCVVEKTVTQNLALEPWCLGNLKESIKNVLDYKIGKFVRELNGILLSFKNLRILQNIGTIRNYNSEVNFQVQADYFVFQPYIGATLKGIVTKKCVTHLVVLLHRVFNVIIPRPTEDGYEQGRTWSGLNIEENQEVVFKIVVFDLYGSLPYIRGTLQHRWMKLRHDDVDEAGEQIHPSYQQPSSEKLELAAKNYTGQNRLSTKHNISIDDNSIYHKQIAGDIEVNLHVLKSKNKRHKDHTQKYCDSSNKLTRK